MRRGVLAVAAAVSVAVTLLMGGVATAAPGQVPPVPIVPVPQELTPEQELAAPEPLVVSKQPDLNGATRLRIFDPAEGVSPEDLVKKLTESGEPNVSLENPDDILGLGKPCVHGTARTWVWVDNGPCFARWVPNGVEPWIHFRDRTSPSWGVSTAAGRWNAALKGVNVSGGQDDCPVLAHCVPVWSGDYGDRGWVGLAEMTADPTGALMLDVAPSYDALDVPPQVDDLLIGPTLWLNNYYGYSAERRPGTACHEMGHALGLGHNSSTSSCLYTWSEPGRTQKPNKDDIALLTQFYPDLLPDLPGVPKLPDVPLPDLPLPDIPANG